MNSNEIVGTWHLQSLVFRTEAGDETHPYGDQVEGQLVYAADGHMNVIMSFSPVDPFLADDQNDGSHQEKIAAFDRFSAYCGRYERRDGAVIHHVAMSLFPNWIGTEQLRKLEFRGDDLVLSMSPRLIDGVIQTVEAVWSRRNKTTARGIGLARNQSPGP